MSRAIGTVDELLGPRPPVPPTPATGELQPEEGAAGTIGAPGVLRPGAAVRTAIFPTLAGAAPIRSANVSADTPLLADDVVVTAAGTVTVTIAVADAVTASLWIDGSKGAGTAWALNGGNALTAGAIYRETVDVVPGDRLNVEVSAGTTASLRLVLREGV